MMSAQRSKARFAACLEDEKCEDLQKGKVYVVLNDVDAERDGYLRVIDDSGEDYLYPASYFAFVTLPREAREALLSASCNDRS